MLHIDTSQSFCEWLLQPCEDYSAFVCKTTGSRLLKQYRCLKKRSSYCVCIQYTSTGQLEFGLRALFLFFWNCDVKKNLRRVEFQMLTGCVTKWLLTCYIKPWEEWSHKNTVCPFSTSDLPRFKVRNDNKRTLSGPYLYIVAAHVQLCVTLQIGFIWVQRKQLKRGRPAVQAEGPSGVGSACVSASITCTQTRRCAVWCSRTGSVWGSCTCLVQLSCSRRGLCRSPSSCSRPGRWPTLSLEPGKAVKASHVKFGNNCAVLYSQSHKCEIN